MKWFLPKGLTKKYKKPFAHGQKTSVSAECQGNTDCQVAFAFFFSFFFFLSFLSPILLFFSVLPLGCFFFTKDYHTNTNSIRTHKERKGASSTPKGLPKELKNKKVYRKGSFLDMRHWKGKEG